MANVLDQVGILGLHPVNRLAEARAELDHNVPLAELERAPLGAVELPVLELLKLERQAPGVGLEPTT